MVFSYIESKLINFSAFQSLCLKKNASNGAIIVHGLGIASSSLWRTSFTRFNNRIIPVTCLFGVKHIYSHHHRLLHGVRRFYHTNRYPLHQPLPARAIVPLQRKTLQLWNIIKGSKLITFLLGACVVVTICFGRIERTPYSRRFHLVLSQKIERKLAEFQWKMFKEKHQAKILPPSDPRSIRVQAIATKIIQALNNGLNLEHECKINGHAPKSVGSIFKDEYQGGASLASRFSTSKHLKGKFGSEEGKGMEKSQKQAQKLKWKPSTKHLNGKSWEIYVVDSYEVDTQCLCDGRIVVDAWMLRRLQLDEELASVIGHEIGHAVASHNAEILLKSLWYFTFLVIFLRFAGPSSGQCMTVFDVFMKYLSRRREAETDYIGLMLMASAGYDPRQAPKLYEKLGGDGGIFDTHPSGSKRAELLSKPKVMREAIAIYEEVRSGQGVRSFI